MQTLKLDVRNRIVESAINEFCSLGYEKSSLRQIAKLAGITVGNIYAYFRDKNALLDAILEPILMDMNKLIDEITSKENNTEDYLRLVASRVVDIYDSHRRQVIILMNTIDNEKYSVFRKKFVDSIAKALMDKVASVKDERLAQIIANSLIAGILTCFRDIPFLRREEAVDVIYEYLHFMFHLEEAM